MEISCMTWNILAQVFLDGNDYNMGNSKLLKTKTRREKIMKNIMSYNADIVMLQEVTIQEYNIFKRHLKQYKILPLAAHKKKWAHDTEGNKIMENGNCILLKKGLFQDIIPTKLQLNEDGVMASICHCNLVEDPSKSLVIISMHLDDLKRSIRNVQLKKILSKLKETTVETIIIGGDFNEKVSYVNNKMLARSGYVSVMQEMVPTYYDTMEYNIDNIYLKRSKLINTYIPRFKNGRDIIKSIGSDHCMIYTVIRI